MMTTSIDEGMTVVAVTRITEGGRGCPGINGVDVDDENHIHAEPGDVGVVEEVNEDDDTLYVVFERTGTGTIVSAVEVRAALVN